MTDTQRLVLRAVVVLCVLAAAAVVIAAAADTGIDGGTVGFAAAVLVVAGVGLMTLRRGARSEQR